MRYSKTLSFELDAETRWDFTGKNCFLLKFWAYSMCIKNAAHEDWGNQRAGFWKKVILVYIFLTFSICSRKFICLHNRIETHLFTCFYMWLCWLGVRFYIMQKNLHSGLLFICLVKKPIIACLLKLFLLLSFFIPDSWNIIIMVEALSWTMRIKAHPRDDGKLGWTWISGDSIE